MATYEISLTGEGEGDAVRAAFESVVNALRSDEGAPNGSLTIDDVPYEATDVADAEEFDESDAAEDLSEDAGA